MHSLHSIFIWESEATHAGCEVIPQGHGKAITDFVKKSKPIGKDFHCDATAKVDGEVAELHPVAREFHAANQVGVSDVAGDAGVENVADPLLREGRTSVAQLFNKHGEGFILGPIRAVAGGNAQRRRGRGQRL